jgi:AcrR family transcriptional regulator
MDVRDSAGPTGRRAEYAQATRNAILSAARDLFTEKGYFATRADEIAHKARVSPTTVYAVGGGKHGLLRTLIHEGATAEDTPQIIETIKSIDEPEALIRYLVHTTRVKFDQWSGLMRQVTAAAAQDPAVHESLEIAHGRLRDGLALGAHQLAQVGALREGMDADGATDVLWFYLCNSAYFIRTDDLGWPPEGSETWLTQALLFALLGHVPASRR